MQLRVTGKNLDIGENLRTHVEARVGENIDKYFDGGYDGHITVEKQGQLFQVDVTVHLDTGVVFQAEGKAADAYVASDEAAEHMGKRLRRYKRKLKDHRGADQRHEQMASYVLEAPEDTDLEKDDHDWASYNPVIVAETSTALRRLSVSEAVMELDVTGSPMILFRHAGHGRLNAVYRRSDGNIGWIDPPADSPSDA